MTSTVLRLAPQLYWPTTQTAQAFGTLVLSRGGDGKYVVERLVPVMTSASGAQVDVALEPGKWALSTIDRRGVESRGAPIVIP